jgi:butyryl-CoA dehydrogenase
VLLTEDQKKIRLNARNFAKKEISPYIRAWEKAGSAPRELYRKMGTVGLMGMTISQEYGGSGLDFVSYVLAVEEISAADGGISNMMSANNSPVAVAIEKFGTETQKQKLLPFLTSGEWLGCIHLTEPHTGSDASAITTRAVQDGDEYVLTGQKSFITGGSTAQIALIIARTDERKEKNGITAFICSTDNPGYKVLSKEKKLGHRTNDTCQVAFDSMRIPATDVLGEVGRGLSVALGGLSLGRIGVAAQSVGGARSALAAAHRYSKDRKTFGKAIIEHQAISFKLAEMATQIEVARQMYLYAAEKHDAGLDSTYEASVSKLFASEMAERVASAAIQIHGGYGYLEDYEVEKIYRDVRVYQIYEGTSEIQKIVISRHLDKIYL